MSVFGVMIDVLPDRIYSCIIVLIVYCKEIRFMMRGLEWMGKRGGGGEERWEKGMTPPSDTNIIKYIIYKSYCINVPLT